jgi:hypothetical protein
MQEGKMRTRVIAKAEVLATHYWPDAPDHRKYLASPHAHVFKIEVKADIEEDRGIEFHDLRQTLQMSITKVGDWMVSPVDFGSRSCETIAKDLLGLIPMASVITVSEDGQFASEVERDGEDTPVVVTLCGSTKFEKEFHQMEDILEKRGMAVFSVGSFPGAQGIELDPELKERLDALHKDKIHMSNAIFVVNPGGYIGKSTWEEIGLARSLGIQIMSLEPIPESQ